MHETPLLKAAFAQPARPNRGDVFAHWAWCLPVILIVAFLAIRQINWYPPDKDEYFTMHNTGYLDGGQFTPVDIVSSLQTYSADQMPIYYLLLGLWENMTGHELGIGRHLSVLCSSLFLAIVYRLASDTIAPTAGILAIVIASSNAFFNFYVSQLRSYPLLLFTAGIVLWLYLRILDERRKAGNRDYFALGLSVFVAFHIHAFIAYFLSIIALFHVFFAQRNRKWRSVIVSVSIAAVISLPFFAVLATRGFDRTMSGWSNAEHSAWETIASWFILSTNGQPLLAAITICGLVLALSQRAAHTTSLALLASIHIVALGIFTDVTGYVLLRRMRYFLPAWLFAVLIMAAALYYLYCYRRWLILLLLLWLISGMIFQYRSEWLIYQPMRMRSYDNPPWQVLAPMAAEKDPAPRILLYRMTRQLLDQPSYEDRTQAKYYFESAGLRIDVSPDPHQLKLMAQSSAIDTPRIWILYLKSDAVPSEIEAVAAAMDSLGYQLCDKFDIGADTAVLDYSWSALGCGALNLKGRAESELITHGFYAASLDEESSMLYFVDAWNRRSEFEIAKFVLSYQLLSIDWRNVAQLELPPVHEGAPRRFSIDVSEVPPGEYRLMAIMYEAETGERIPWQDNEGFVPEMLELDRIVIR